MTNSVSNRNLMQRIYAKLYRIMQVCFHQIIRKVCTLLPLKKQNIVLESEGDFTDNIRVFYEYMLEHGYNHQYKLIWIVHEPEKYEKHENVEFVSRYGLFSFKANFYCAISRFFLFSHPYWFKKVRSEQVVINTTHSVAPTKNQKFIPFDYLIVCSPYCGEIKKQVLTVNHDQMLDIGMPRIDLMFQHIDCIRKLLPEYHGQSVILSMQTFKQSAAMTGTAAVDPYALNVIHSEEEIRQLDQYLGLHNCILINKIHHLQNLDYISNVSLQNIVYLTDKELLSVNCTVNQLLENADILFTDYSSVFYEFLLKNRPIGFLIGDLQDYSRGFIMEEPLREMPGKKIQSFDDMIDFLEHYPEYESIYAPERERVKNQVFSHPDAHNCDRLYQWIENQNRR